MRESNDYRRRAGRLVAQDPEINDQQMEELRMQLEQSLDACEQKVRWVRKRIVIGLVVYVFCMLSYLASMSLMKRAANDIATERMRELMLVPFLVAALTAGFIGLTLVMRYIFVHVPRLTRARFELQTSLLQELQQQVRRLQQLVQQREKG